MVKPRPSFWKLYFNRGPPVAPGGRRLVSKGFQAGIIIGMLAFGHWIMGESRNGPYRVPPPPPKGTGPTIESLIAKNIVQPVVKGIPKQSVEIVQPKMSGIPKQAF